MTKEAKNEITYDHADKTAIVNGWTYLLTAVPEKERDALALLQLATWVGRQKEPQAAFKELCAGVRHVVRGEKAEKIDLWRQAAANVHARAELKGLGIKPPPGKKLDDTPEFADKVAQALERSKAWDRATLAKVKGHGLVVAEHQKLTGAGDDLSALFVAPVAPTQTVAETEAGQLGEMAAAAE